MRHLQLYKALGGCCMLTALLPGDVVIQTGGQPWVFGAWLFTGYGMPHAAMVDHVDADGTIWVIEDTYNGVQLNRWAKPDWLSRRPLCDESIRLAALCDYKARVGQESYGYWDLLVIALLDRVGLLHRLAQDPLEATNKKTCSESISYHQRKAGYAPCPELADRSVLPADLALTPHYTSV